MPNPTQASSSILKYFLSCFLFLLLLLFPSRVVSAQSFVSFSSFTRPLPVGVLRTQSQDLLSICNCSQSKFIQCHGFKYDPHVTLLHLNVHQDLLPELQVLSYLLNNLHLDYQSASQTWLTQSYWFPLPKHNPVLRFWVFFSISVYSLAIQIQLYIQVSNYHSDCALSFFTPPSNIQQIRSNLFLLTSCTTQISPKPLSCLS